MWRSWWKGEWETNENAFKRLSNAFKRFLKAFERVFPITIFISRVTYVARYENFLILIRTNIAPYHQYWTNMNCPWISLFRVRVGLRLRHYKTLMSCQVFIDVTLDELEKSHHMPTPLPEIGEFRINQAGALKRTLCMTYDFQCNLVPRFFHLPALGSGAGRWKSLGKRLLLVLVLDYQTLKNKCKAQNDSRSFERLSLQALDSRVLRKKALYLRSYRALFLENIFVNKMVHFRFLSARHRKVIGVAS